MKKYLTIFFAISFSVCNAQIEDPVDWSFTAKKINSLTYEVHLTATIESGWHVYSQTTPPGGPVATAIIFKKNSLLMMSQKLKELGKLEKHYEKLFGVTVKQFSNKVDYVQVIKLKSKVKTNLAGSVEFMTCNDEKCLPPRIIDFSIPLR